VSRDFFGFFIKQSPIGIHGLKPFCIWLRIRRENRCPYNSPPYNSPPYSSPPYNSSLFNSPPWQLATLTTRHSDISPLCSGIRKSIQKSPNAETEIFCQSSPLILTFSSNYGFPLKGMRTNIRFCKDSHGVIKFPRSHWDRGIRFRGLIETAGTDSAVSLRPPDPTWKVMRLRQWTTENTK
jgi:hypothetical protein